MTGFLDPEASRYLQGQHTIDVQPRQAVRLSARIRGPQSSAPTAVSQKPATLSKKGPSLDPEEKIIQFGELNPDRQSYTVVGTEVEHDGARQVPVNVSVAGFWHVETKQPLDRSLWCEIAPAQGIAGQAEPFVFDFTLHFPKRMPPGLSDGLYQGTLRVESPEAATSLILPFQVTINLPDIITAPVNLPETGLLAELSCCLPGSRTLRFDVQTDALAEQKVRVIVPPIVVSETTGGVIPADQLRVLLADTMEEDGEIVIPKAGKKQEIRLRVLAETTQLPSGFYTGQLSLRPKMGRGVNIPVNISIPSEFLAQKIGWIAAGAGLLLALIGFLGPVRRLISGHNRFYGSRFEVQRDRQQYHIPNPWKRILNFSYVESAQAWKLKPNTKNWEISPMDRPTRQGLTTEITIEEERGTRRFSLRLGREQYEIQLVSGWSKTALTFEVTQSPYRIAGNLAFTLLLALLAGLGAALAINPELICRIV